MKRKLRKTVSCLLIFIGITLLIYPYISEFLFEHRVESEIAAYEKSVSKVSDKDSRELMDSAKAYNHALAESEIRIIDPFFRNQSSNQDEDYRELLKAGDTEIMGYIEIPAIALYLPVYHGTSESVLEKGIGHLEGTSLPIGGESTHAVLTGHTGVNKAKLFTDLTDLKEEDLFRIHVLGQVLTYKVTSINVVAPEDVSELRIQKGEDMITLVTCTPYGINSHRLLVHGHRIDDIKEHYEDEKQYSNPRTESQWRGYYKRAVLMGLAVAALILLLSALKKQNYWGIFLIISGIAIFFIPDVMECLQDIQTEITIKEYEEVYSKEYRNQEDVLYQEMQYYNQTIYENGQIDLKDPWSYEHITADGVVADNKLFGYIEIPVMEQRMPLYMGATEEHMAEGVAIMGGTSLPIGGTNSNSVIAGHRGYNRYKTFFKNIEKIKIGDTIYITNPWEKLEYTVDTIDIVEPDDIESIKIQDGREMVTLLTCHPYASNGRYRYLVYCVRNRDQRVAEMSEKNSEAQQRNHVVSSDGTIYESSKSTINREELFRKVCSILLLIYLFFFVRSRINKRRNR